ncbi:nadh2 dehydrogenase subunit 14k, partial [Colletotrichum incanum]
RLQSGGEYGQASTSLTIEPPRRNRETTEAVPIPSDTGQLTRPIPRQVTLFLQSTMVGRILFWSGFGFAVRFWQMGIEMRPFFNKESLWAYPAYMLGGGSFGYWLQGVDDKQTSILNERKSILLEKRARAAARKEEEEAAKA